MTSDRMPSSNDGLPESGATLRSRTVSGSIWTLFGTLAGAPAGLVATLLTARFLGVSGFGRYALLMYVSTLATALSELGMTTILQRRVALAFGRGDRREELLAAQQALVAIAFRLIAMFAVCLVLIQDPLALTLVAASAVLGVVPASAMVLLTGTSRSAIMAKTALASTLLGYTALLTVSGTTHRPDLAFGAYMAAAALPHVALLWMTDRPVRHLLRVTLPRPARSEWRYGLMSFINAQLSTLVFSRSGLMFFPSNLQAGRGAFAAASTVGSRVTLAIDALFGPIPVALVAIYARGSTAYRKGLTALFRLSATLFAMTFPVLSVLAVAVAPYLFPKEFGDLTTAILVLVGVSMLQTAAQPATAAWTAEGNAGPLLAASVVAGVVNLSSSAILIPRFGLPAAVGCSAGAALIYLVWLSVAFRGRLDAREYARYLAIIVGSTALGAILGLGLKLSPIPRPVGGLVFLLVALIGGALIVRLSGVLGEEEVRLFTRAALGGRLSPMLKRLERPLRLLAGKRQPSPGTT